jgi:hypothetical protein
MRRERLLSQRYNRSVGVQEDIIEVVRRGDDTAQNASDLAARVGKSAQQIPVKCPESS